MKRDGAARDRTSTLVSGRGHGNSPLRTRGAGTEKAVNRAGTVAEADEINETLVIVVFPCVDTGVVDVVGHIGKTFAEWAVVVGHSRGAGKAGEQHAGDEDERSEIHNLSSCSHGSDGMGISALASLKGLVDR